MKQLVFNNIISSDLGIVVVEGSPEILTQEVYKKIDVEGRNGSLIVNQGYYKDIEKKFLLTTVEHFEEDEIPDMIQKVKDWLFNIEDSRLLYSHPDRYNIVKKVVTGDIKTSLEEYGDFEVTFICEPFYYAVEYEIESKETEMTLYNYGDFESYPKIEIYGNAKNLMLNINAQQMVINSVTNYIEIDSKLMIVRDKIGNKLMATTGEFPTLSKDENIITITGVTDFEKVVITPRTIYR